MQKKLCFIIRSLAGGGAERVLNNLANHFSLNGYNVTLICLNQDEAKYITGTQVKVRSLVSRKDKENFLNRTRYALVTFVKLMQALKEEQPFCCISFMTSVNLWTGLSCILLKKAFIVSERTSPYYTLDKFNALTKWLAFNIYRRAKGVVLPAKAMIGSLNSIEQFEGLKNLYAISNPIVAFDIPKKNIVHDKPFILSIGRLDYNKGFDLLIAAFYQLNPPNMDLLLVGVGPDKYLLKKKVANLGLKSRVKFIGFRKNLQDYYTQAKLFVLASRVEGYPNVLVEAMSLGCPVVATDCDFGPAEIINHGVNGLLVKSEDINGLVNAIESILISPKLRVKLATNAKTVNQTNSIGNIAEKWENIILS